MKQNFITTPDLASVLGISPQATGKQIREVDIHSEVVGSKRFIPNEGVRKVFESRGFVYPKINVIFHCLKGGASKTTLAYNTAFRLSQLGARVLLVDLDKQANATRSFRIEKPERVFVDIVIDKAKIKDLVVPINPFLHIIPSSLENARLEMELIRTHKNPENFYQSIFEPIRMNYDVVILDLPPDLNHNTYLSTLFANVICIPTNPDDYSVSGMKMTLNSIEDLHSEYPMLNSRQKVYIIWSKYDARERNSLHFLTDFEAKSKINVEVMPVVVRSDATFKNAQTKGVSVFEYKRNSNAAEDVDLLSQELIGMREKFSKKGNA